MRLNPSIFILVTAVSGLWIGQGSQEPAELESRIASLEQWREKSSILFDRLGELLALQGQKITVSRLDDNEQIMKVSLLKKAFHPFGSESDGGPMRARETISWDAEYAAIGLARPARSIKGVLKFCDLFGDPHCQVPVTIASPINPGETTQTRGSEIEFRHSEESSQWLFATEPEGISCRFEVEMILYSDGTVEKFTQ